MSSHKIGIDFGTSNSTCAVLEGRKAKLIPLEGDSLTLPSSIFFSHNGDIFFGRKSVAAYLEGEEGRFMRGLKSILGTSLMHEKTLVNKKSIDFKGIITIYMRHLKEQAENHINGEIRDVVLGRPVHFHDNNPEADQASENTLREIAKSIGFQNISFQYEPIAAAFAHEKELQKDQLALVVDLGGGTSDFTVIRLSPEKSARLDRANDILATTGIRVGGTNFDQKLSINAFMPHLGLGSEYLSGMGNDKILPIPMAIYYQLSDWPQVNYAQTRKTISDTKSLLRAAIEPEKIERLLHIQEAGLGHAFLHTVENTKIALTDKDQIEADLSAVNLGFNVHVSRIQFEEAIAEQIARISLSIDDCMNKARIEKNEISLIVLTGGSSELPIINAIIKEKFPHAHVSNDNKFGSVGLGLAYNAEWA